MKAFNSFIELHVKILNLFRDKEPCQFNKLMNDYTCLLKEIVVITSNQSSEVAGGSSFKLKLFVTQEPIALTADCLLKSEGLEINSITECTLLQINITKVIFVEKCHAIV